MLVDHFQKIKKKYMPYGDSKDSTIKTASDKIFRDKTFSIAKNSK